MDGSPPVLRPTYVVSGVLVFVAIRLRKFDCVFQEDWSVAALDFLTIIDPGHASE